MTDTDVFTAARAELCELRPAVRKRTRAPATGRGPKARVYAFPVARNVHALEEILTAYLALFHAHGHPKAAKLFETRLADPIRRRLRAAGVSEEEIWRETEDLKVALKALYYAKNPALRGASA